MLSFPSSQKRRAEGAERGGNEKQALYFAYGSNLSFSQMARRCPQSRFIGRARLRNHRFQINERGFANVVADPTAYVDGVCYRLVGSDEGLLDLAEGVPTAYQKVDVEIELFQAPPSLLGRDVANIVRYRRHRQPSVLQDSESWPRGTPATALVYLSNKYTSPGMPWDEYILRMEEGLREALRIGISKAYVDRDVRPWLVEGKGSRETPVKIGMSSSSPRRKTKRKSVRSLGSDSKPNDDDSEIRVAEEEEAIGN